MVKRIDGWALMKRIAARPDGFGACGKTAELAALLIVRNQLVQGVTDTAALVALADIVGPAAMIEVIENLAAYEASRVAANIDGDAPPGVKRAPEAIRRRLIEIVQTHAADAKDQPFAEIPQAEGAGVVRILRRHSALAARRIRPAQ